MVLVPGRVPKVAGPELVLRAVQQGPELMARHAAPAPGMAPGTTEPA